SNILHGWTHGYALRVTHDLVGDSSVLQSHYFIEHTGRSLDSFLDVRLIFTCFISRLRGRPTHAHDEHCHDAERHEEIRYLPSATFHLNFPFAKWRFLNVDLLPNASC